MYARGFKQVLYKEYICWIQVKIQISDQTSLRFCNSVWPMAMFYSESPSGSSHSMYVNCLDLLGRGGAGRVGVEQVYCT